PPLPPWARRSFWRAVSPAFLSLFPHPRFAFYPLRGFAARYLPLPRSFLPFSLRAFLPTPRRSSAFLRALPPLRRLIPHSRQFLRAAKRPRSAPRSALFCLLRPSSVLPY